MNTPTTSWLALGTDGSAVRCAVCQTDIDLETPRVDHHPSVCPHCGVGCAFLNWKGRVLQVVPSHAPSGFQRVLHFMQHEFDELEYAEFISTFEDVADYLHSCGLVHSA